MVRLFRSLLNNQTRTMIDIPYIQLRGWEFPAKRNRKPLVQQEKPPHLRALQRHKLAATRPLGCLCVQIICEAVVASWHPKGADEAVLDVLPKLAHHPVRRRWDLEGRRQVPEVGRAAEVSNASEVWRCDGRRWAACRWQG